MKESEKQILINTINSSGVILEEQLFSLLSRSRSRAEIEKGKTFTFQNERIEIDCLMSTPRLRYLFECKKSIYSFFFLRSMEYENSGYLVQQMPNLKVTTLPHQEITKGAFKVFSYCLEMLENQGLFQRSKKNKIESLPEMGERAGREDLMQGFVRQTLKNLEAYIWKLRQQKNFCSEIITFLPVIVTNAKLYSLEFKHEQIDFNGDLKECTDPKEEK